MRSLSLDFESKRRNRLPGYGLLAIGAVAAALVAGAQMQLEQEIGRYPTPAPALDTGPGKRMLPGALAAQAETLAGARAVVGHLAGPREKLFKTLEAIDAPDVALLALTPNTQKRSVRILGEARTFGAMLSYLRALERSRIFGQVVLVEHEIMDTDPQRPVRFNLSAEWGR
jgi:hypothetical protein